MGSREFGLLRLAREKLVRSLSPVRYEPERDLLKYMKD